MEYTDVKCEYPCSSVSKAEFSKGSFRLYDDHSEYFIFNGDFHKTNGPAIYIWRNKYGLKRIEEYFIKGVMHRSDGPARIYYYSSQKLEFEHWVINGELHRVGEPAVLSYYSSGAKRSEEYYIRGELHNENGPASIHYDRYGKLRKTYYCLDGKSYSKKDYDKKKSVKLYW